MGTVEPGLEYFQSQADGEGEALLLQAAHRARKG